MKIDNKMMKQQYGFRKNKSTKAAIHKLIRKIETAITNNNHSIGVFMDIEGAFDNVKFTCQLKSYGRKENSYSIK